MDDLLSKSKFSAKNSDLAVAILLFMMLAVLIVPIAPFLLDLLLVVTLAASVMILLMSIYTKKPLDFSTFPSILLLSY